MASQTDVKVASLPGSHNITRTELPNGIVVLVYENFAAQSVVIGGSFTAGSVYETPRTNGLAAMTASALMRGTQARDFRAIATALEDVGADLSISAGVFRASFFGKGLAEDLGVLFDVLADVVRQPAFPVAQLERLRGEVMTGLLMRYQDTRFRANRAFHETMYPADHPFHYSTRGTPDSVARLTVDDLIAFHRTHYGPKGMIIGVVGAVKAEDAVEAVRAGFGDWENAAQPEVPTLPDLPQLSETQRTHMPLAGKSQSDIVLGVPGPSRFADDYLAAQIANSILGQFGMMGRIGASVREDLGLAYYAYSDLEGGMGPGPWSVAAGVNPDNVDLAIERIKDELRRLITEEVSEADLQDNQSYYVGRIPLQLESNEGVVSAILNMEMYRLGLDYLVNYRDTIYQLTPRTLLAAAQHYLNPDALIIGIAGPDKKL